MSAIPPRAALGVARVARAFERFCRAPGRSGSGVLVAISGGADSTALARLVDLLARQEAWRSRLPEVWLGHVHHGLRGAEADADAAFAQALAERLGRPFLHEALDGTALRGAAGAAFETRARQARLAILTGWARRLGVGLVAVGHHAEDQRETVLLNLARGAGPRGLRGMPRRRPLGDGPPPRPHLVRPLLDWERGDILGVLADLGQDFREDSSNAIADGPRNVIRRRILPLLAAEVHPGARRSLTRLSRVARVLSSTATRLATALWTPIDDDGGALRIERERLEGLPAALRHTVIDSALRALSTSMAAAPALESRHCGEIDKALGARRAHTVGLGSGWTISCDGRHVFVRAPAALRDAPAESAATAATTAAASLDLGGVAGWRGWTFSLQAGAPRPPDADGDRFAEIVDLGRLVLPLRIRARAPGDRFRPLGAPGRQKLKEFLRAAGLPRSRRNDWPLFLQGPATGAERPEDEIIWVVGCRIGETVAVRPDTTARARLLAVPPPQDRL